MLKELDGRKDNMARVALVGNMRSGKNTFGDILVKEYGYTEISFADELKRICKELFPEQFKNGNKPREILQNVGQCMRSIDYDVWVKALDRKIKHYDGKNLVITDVRYPNEVDYLRNNGFIIVQIIVYRSIIVGRCKATDPNFNPAQLDHESESMASSYIVGDILVYNNNSLEEYLAKVHQVISEIERGVLNER